MADTNSGDEDVASSLGDVIPAFSRHGDLDTGKCKEKETPIATKESKAVRWIRIIAIAVIVSSTLGVALGVFYYMTNTEKKTFAYRFDSDSYKVLESIGSTFDRSLGSVDAFSVGLVSTAKQTNQTWPFVAISDYPARSSKTLLFSKGVQVSIFMYVTHAQRPAWNNYSNSHDGWVEESLGVQERALNKTFFGPINSKWTPASDIYQNVATHFESEFYLVSWQSYPIIPTEGFPSYSFDFWEYPGPSAERMLETHMASISLTSNLPDLNDPDDVAFNKAYAEYFRSYLPPGRDPSEPYCEIYYVRMCR
jgi:hypothetical protein